MCKLLSEQDAKDLGHWYEVFNQHKGSNVIMRFETLDECYQQAAASAKLEHDSFYRVFKNNRYDGARFLVGISVLGGKLRLLDNVNIPGEHC